MSFGGPTNPYQPPGPPAHGPYPPPPYVPPQPGPAPYGYPHPHPHPPHPHPQPYPYPYVPQPQPGRGGLRGGEWPSVRELLRQGQPRVSGCVWLVLLAPCTWFVFLPLVLGYSFARSARIRARRLFPHTHRAVDDRRVTRVQQVRAWTAAAMSLLLLAVYGKPEDVTEAQEQYMMRLVVTPPLLLLSAPVVIAVLFRWASAETRSAMRARVRVALRSARWYVGAVMAVPLLGGVIIMLGRNQTPSSGSAGAAPWLILATALPLAWLLFFLGFATGPAVRTGFNTAAVHAALPALLTGTLVWEFAAMSLVAGGLPPGPPLIQALAVIGGPASVTAVVWWEIRRLRTLYGVTLRA
ncbi:hypothetical protein ACIP4U_26595 [Streptomyces caelestis]|uniref:Uncharacterized protein n=1 Tax=Streptomyces caelestis TaxID=36816 RepID=A0A7W9HA66_9ACTN|nr:hypothetical protein [Streptomyces caelestis]MBB5798502.1 hypothetical protein [Streptomyces caelestis]GGW50794.1 hypothetical protein GCM10010320_34300 [Streptomyces caelestis]